MISFVHITSTGNTGDLASGPYRYFRLGPHRVYNYTQRISEGPVVVGGGTMTNWLRGSPPLPDGPRVAWGIGSSRHGEREPWPDPQGFDLLGVREWSPEREAAGKWAPCASCMSKLFDRPRRAVQRVAWFVNADPSIRTRYPLETGARAVLTNAAPMEECLAFLGSAEVIVTDSYHGAYWAMLLGRRVVVVPYSSKFYGFRYPLAYSTRRGADWQELAEQTSVYSDALSAHRSATRDFAALARSALR